MKKGLFLFVLVFAISALIALLWDKLPFISNLIHNILDPTFGYLINLNLVWGFIFIIFLINILMTLVQKYTTDQAALKQLKEEQKANQEEMKKYRNDPTKMMELQKKQLENIPKTFELTMKPLIFTIIPLILLIRWFSDIFTDLGDPRFLGFLSWIWFYIIISIILSIILRKLLKVH